jgi:hypothetical protein
MVYFRYSKAENEQTHRTKHAGKSPGDDMLEGDRRISSALPPRCGLICLDAEWSGEPCRYQGACGLRWLFG